MRILAILQARSSSNRLPNKVLKPILGRAMILRQLERLKLCDRLDKLVIATSIDSSDNELESLLKKENYSVYRGSLHNVLDRYYKAALNYKADHVIRLTGDCPLIDPQLIDQVIEMHLFKGADYTSNCFPATYPDGLDVEVARFSSLEKAWKCAKLPSEIEHVTPYIKNHPELFNNYNLEYEKDLSNHRWTVDEPEDFKFVEQIYAELYPKNMYFCMNDVLELLELKPHLMKINYHIQRNINALKSYEKDTEYLSNKR